MHNTKSAVPTDKSRMGGFCVAYKAGGRRTVQALAKMDLREDRPDATVLIYGMPNEDAAHVDFSANDANVAIAGKAFEPWDREALIERVATSSGRGDVAVTDAAGVLQAVAFSAIGISSLQVGCIAGAVSIAAFKAVPEVANAPAAFAAAVALLVDALAETAGNAVDPIVVVQLGCSGVRKVAAAAEMFDLCTIECGTGCIAFFNYDKSPSGGSAGFTFQRITPGNSDVLEMIAVPCTLPQPPSSVAEAYGDALFAANCRADVRPPPEKPATWSGSAATTIRSVACALFVCVVVGLWICAYPPTYERAAGSANGSGYAGFA